MKDINHHLFYSNNITNDTISLDKTETNHAVSVLRINPGQQIQITDGNGTIYNCQCTNITTQSAFCQIITKTAVPKITPELTLLVGLPDKDPFEMILEHAAALGVFRVVPLVMDHCRKPWWESWGKLRERFMAKMVVSMKQCLYPYIPLLDEPLSLNDIIDKCEKPIVVADQHGEKISNVDLSLHKKLTCLVGPPGGLSVDEMVLLKSRGSLPVKIAPNRLKTELAVTVFCSWVTATCM
jgi:16S rRNA (uracil1498-N3)-methyltransferase